MLISQKSIINGYCHTHLNSKLGRPYFTKINHKHKPHHKTTHHFFSAPTQPNWTKFRMLPCFSPTRRSFPSLIVWKKYPDKTLLSFALILVIFCCQRGTRQFVWLCILNYFYGGIIAWYHILCILKIMHIKYNV